MLHAMDDDEEVDNDINDNNLNIDHDDAKIDKNVDTDNLDADHNDDELLRFHNINDILGTTWFAPHAQVAEELHMVRLNELTSFIEAEHISRWRKVMMEEMTSIDYDEVFPPVAQLDSMRLLIPPPRRTRGGRCTIWMTNKFSWMMTYRRRSTSSSRRASSSLARRTKCSS
jgi:hypothetical protein